MRLAVLMDSLEMIKPYKDTSIALLKAAQNRGWHCRYFTQADIFCESGNAYAKTAPIIIGDINQTHWVEVGSSQDSALTDFDIILMRKDPPFNLEYIYATYALELAENKGVLVANKPQSLRDANEKFYTLNFPKCCPPTLVTSNIERLRDFWKDYQSVIFKPLEGMGGKQVFYVDKKATNLSVILDILTNGGTVNIMAQLYLPEITTTGDKRILLINGEPVPYGLARIPAKGELRGNLAAGAKGIVVPITDRDRWLCEQIGPTLREKGLYFVGIDVIGDFVTEINVTSPTCLQEIARDSNLDIAGDYLTCLENKCHF